MKPLIEILPFLQSQQKIAITTHQNPDADALGSSLALQLYFQKLGHEVMVFSSTPFPKFLNWMPQSNRVLIYEYDNKMVSDKLHQCSILFCLDFNTPNRTKTFTPEIEKFAGTKVLIDHHMFPAETFFDYGNSITAKSSTCEMVYDFIIDSKQENTIDIAIAKCLYAGTMTDTGSFRFSCTSASTHIMVANLMQKGLQPSIVHENIFDTSEEKRLRLLGYALSQRMEVFPKKNVAIIHLNATDLNKFDAGSGDTEGIVNFPLGIEGIQMAVFLSEKEGEIRMSFRSKGNIDVNEFARNNFNGGGHVNAAGGKSNESMEATISKLKSTLDLN